MQDLVVLYNLSHLAKYYEPPLLEPLPLQPHTVSYLSSVVSMDPTVKYLLSLGAIRDRARIVGQAANAGNLIHFDVHEDKLDDVADFVTSVIKVRSIHQSIPTLNSLQFPA